jgi:uncharacterized protein with NRDE domain
MCTVIVVWQWREDVPLVVAANRDELLARPSDPPLLLEPDPPRWGGRDLVAGGTWLAVNPAGRVGAVTNRHPGGEIPTRDPQRSSRGRLPLEALAGSSGEAKGWLRSLEPGRYNPVNVLYLAPDAALWAGVDDAQGTQVSDLAPGVHVITEQNLDDLADNKGQRILRESSAAVAAASSSDDLVGRLRRILRSHDSPNGAAPACVHGEMHGTVSSATIVVTGAAPGPYGVQYEHADGRPCVTAYERVPTDSAG